ncbi:glycoside hydrolase family 20 zincin-like fold domain-containing protein [Paenibacillus beijingensis]|uniref:beta-N-acetylhexosaminidase n=1 Tax=Paenibacillus beijingensis TaxID=1126833 RepID=A0A0D5NGQ8_9BACL|nr:glycoside hydrolase family 20 zincin-like fold domain-containing protein [Paenibacillus beijingensis]AJY74310.1 hypothetical protein VN24_06610 [Paenibacillus beijingensis]
MNEGSLSSNDWPLVPYPKHIIRTQGAFDLGNGGIVYEAYDAGAAFMAEHISSRCEEVSGCRPHIGIAGTHFPTPVTYEWDNSLAEEAYQLSIRPDRIAIIASAKRGRWYGAMTLCQLINADGTVPCMEIEDKPDFRIRAISDDISRGQVSTLEHFKRIIRFCSEYKINTYFLYIEDLFRFQKNPRIGIGRGGLTADEIRELAEYARDRFVDLSPLFESLGHQDQMVKMPEYGEFREGEGSFSFAPADPRTLRLMEDFYRELAGAFSSPILFAGLDETTDIGSGRSKPILDKFGHAKVYADYYNGLNRIAKSLGKQLWIYATLAIDYPDSLDLIDKDIVMVNYTFSGPGSGDAWWDNLYTYMPIVIEKGFTEVVSPSIINWKRMFPDYTWGYGTTAALNKEGIEHGCIGSMNASWADDGGENFREYNWYGYGFQAEMSWNARKPVEQGLFAARFGAAYFGPGREHLGTALWHLGKVETDYSFGTFETLYGGKIFIEPFVRELGTAQKAKESLDAFRQLWFQNESRLSVSRNAENLQYIDFAYRRARFVTELPFRSNRLLTLFDEWKRKGEEKLRTEAMNELEQLARQMKQFRYEFEALWRRSCRIEGMDYNLTRMDGFVHKVEKMKEQWHGDRT